MEKSTTIDLCSKIFKSVFITIGTFMAVPMILLAAEVIGARLAPEGMELPFTLERLGLADIEKNSPGLFTTYLYSLFFALLSAVYLLVSKQFGKIERIASWTVFCVSLLVLLPTTNTILKENRKALTKAEEDRSTYMGVQMDDFSKAYLSKNGWNLTKHENCGDNFVRKGEHYSGDPLAGYLDAWSPDNSQVYQAEKQQPVGPGTYRVVCAARAEGSGVYIFATTTSKKYGVKLVEVPHYGNTEGEIWENALDGSAEKEANMGNGYGWSKVVVTITIDDNDTLVYGVTSDSKFTGRPFNSQWFSAADFTVERVAAN